MGWPTTGATRRRFEAGDDDAGLRLRCDTQDKQLILEIEGRDQRVVRTAEARAGEDHIDLVVAGKRFRVFPASSTQKAKVVPAGPRVAGSATDKGFVIELAWPVSRFPRRDRLPVSATFADCDSAAALKTERSVTLDGELAFSAGPSTLDTLLEERGLSRSLVRFRHPLRLGKHHAEIVLVGKLIALVSEGYSYVELPVADGKDVAHPQIVDLAGDGRQAILLEYVERGDSGERTILAAYRPDGDKLTRIFAAEIGKRTQAGKLSTRYTLRRHGRATDLVLEAMPAQGLDATSYKEAPAADVLPILLPWSTTKKATYAFSGDGYTQK